MLKKLNEKIFERKLKKLGIRNPIKLDNETIRKISQKVIELLIVKFPFLEEEYNNMLAKLMVCNIYHADIDQNIAKINYIYDNCSIYIDYSIDLSADGLEKLNFTEQLINESLHYIQDCRYENKKLKKLGLCTFNDFKVSGLGLNEAVVQYISRKVIESDCKNIFPEHKYDKKYFLLGLAEVVLELLGEEILIKGTLLPNQKVQDYILNTFENNTNKILKNFDIMLEKSNSLWSEASKDNTNSIENIEVEMKQVYFETKNIIATSYFEKELAKIDERKKIQDIFEKIEKYKKLLLEQAEKDEFDIYIEKLTYKINEAMIRVKRLENQRSLMVISKSKFQKLIEILKERFNIA